MDAADHRSPVALCLRERMSITSPRIHFDEVGFVVAEHDNALWLCCRKTYGPAVGAFISGGVLFIVAVNSLVIPLSVAHESDTSNLAVLVVSLLTVATLACAVFAWFYRLWRRRSEMPLQDALMATIADGEIRGPGGDILGSADSASTLIRLDLFDNSRGKTRKVILSFPGRRMVVFRTTELSDAQQVQQLLNRFGIRIQS